MMRPKITITKIFFCVLSLNFLALMAFFIHVSAPLTNPSSNSTNIPPITPEATNKNLITIKQPHVYYFDNPHHAYLLLSEFDTFKPLPNSMKSMHGNSNFVIIKGDEKYCEKSRKYFVNNPEDLFLKRNVLTNRGSVSLFTSKVLSQYAIDIMPQVRERYHDFNRGRKPFGEQEPLYLREDVSMYFMKTDFASSYELGKHYGCNHQVYNHVYDATQMNSKSNLALNYDKYFTKYKDRPQCAEHFMPESYIMKSAEQCRAFFSYINSEAYEIEKQKTRFVFFLKMGRGAHRGEGVFLFDEAQERDLRKAYNNGTNCNSNSKDLQLQRYINNPMLLDGHKFDFRVYMLIASVDPLIVYYHDGFLKLSMHDYDRNSSDKAVHLSNTELSKQIFEQANKPGGWKGMNETELRRYQTWLYYRLQAYLLDHNFTKDPNWVQNSMIPQMKKAMIHVARMIKYALIERVTLYEVFGCDFMLDENLKIWFIEANTNPMMEGTTEEREKLLISMLSDHFEVMYALLRSRMKRVVQFINNLLKEIPAEYIFENDIHVPDFEQKKAQYDAINKNGMDPEFAVRPENGFKLVVDENLQDEGRYGGFIPKECF